MTVALWCLFAAGVLIVLSKGPALVYMARQPKGYDNRHPRSQQARLEGIGARAVAAHYNTIESFPLFAVGIIVAHLYAPEHAITEALAIGFIVARIAYIWLYVRNIAMVRSVVWGLSYLASLALLLAPLYANVLL